MAKSSVDVNVTQLQLFQCGSMQFNEIIWKKVEQMRRTTMGCFQCDLWSNALLTERLEEVDLAIFANILSLANFKSILVFLESFSLANFCKIYGRSTL